MIDPVMIRAALALALVVALPASAMAQSESATPEGLEWQLVNYAVDGESVAVPWTADASLLLSDGAATGSSGCNDFTGTYELNGDSLTFDDTFAMTLAACPDPESSVETAYMANLPLVASWSGGDERLELSDAEGSSILEFEQAATTLTPSDLATIAAQFDEQAAQLDRLDERLDNVGIGTLRDRIKQLESQVQQLRASQSSSSSSGGSTGSGGSGNFSAAERVLLKGIPASIRRTCTPLRGTDLPNGTVASVRCSPRPNLLSEMAYYLMENQDAQATMQRVTRANNATRRGNCQRGRTGYRPAGGFLSWSEACFVRNGKANLRLIDTASACHQLDVAGTQMRRPTIYVAMEGVNNKIVPLTRYIVTSGRDEFIPLDVTRTIPFGTQPRSACP